MKILVLSDSHGNIENMCRCVDLVKPCRILHLGDHIRDAEALRRLYPGLPLETVPGNCDWGCPDAGEKLLEAGGQRILMMHGHTRRVKETKMDAILAARQAGADILLFGHTHRAMVDRDGPLWIMNPGAAGDPLRPGYGVITIEADRTDCSVFRL